jgi:DNA-directed RNA polymerase subunit L
MNPNIQLNSDKNSDMLLFTLSGVNVSIANAIRRTILSDIPLIVFKTSPNEENKCTIITNTSRLNNEIIKQRLGCIPIHIKDIDEFPIKNYFLEVNIENTSDTVMYVTTQDFKIKDKTTDKYLDQEKMKEIFLPNDYTGYFIDFIRLRPRISEDLPGEKIHLTCEFSIGTAKEDGMFNAVSTCSYKYTIDDIAQDTALEKKKQEWKNEGKNLDEIKFESDNWKLLDGMRITKKDSFDFVIQSESVYTDLEIVMKSCNILNQKLSNIDTLIDKDELKINNSQNTMSNCFDIILENEDYTIGKVLEYFLFSKFYETKIITFCGFKKMHPHDNESIIRVAYKDAVDKSSIKGHLKECIHDATQLYTKIQKEFTKFVK